VKLTARSISTLQLPRGKTDHLFWDDDIPGFGLRLRAGGSRSWVFQYALGDRQRRLSLGAATAESFKAGIRDRAAQLHARVKLGEDPAGDKAEAQRRAGDTFESITRKYLAAKRAVMRPGSYDEVERHILKHAKPLHGLQVASIARRDIATLIGAIRESSGLVAANRTRSSLSDFFSWAMQEGLDSIESNPVIGTNKFKEASRERVLRDHELALIWEHAGDDHFGSIMKLLMLTGQRADEIASLRWSEITKTTVPEKRVTDTIKLPQFEVRVIELPGARTKNKKPHLIPLAPTAAAILDSQVRRTNADGELRDLIFGVGQGGFSGWSHCRKYLDARIGVDLEHWTPHDLRRTVSTLMNERLGILPHVVEAVLNHIGGAKGGVAGIYNKAVYLRERVEALSLWDEHLMSIVKNRKSNVASLRRAVP
jgi:integrase